MVLRLADVSTTGELAGPSDLRLVGLTTEEREKYGLRRGDVLIFRVNGSRSITGQAVVYEGAPGFAYCDHFIRVRLCGEMEPHFFALQLRQGDARRAVEAGMVTTAGQNTISQKTLADIPILCAPVAEQKRIVAKIEALTARSRRAKEALDAVPPLLDKLRQSILAAAFRGDLTADWRAKNPNVEPADKLLTRIRAERRARWVANEAAHGRTRSNYREATETVPEEPRSALPNGWAWVTAEECAWDITVGHVGPMKHRYASAGIPFLRSQNVRENRFDRDGLLYVRVHGAESGSRVNA